MRLAKAALSLVVAGSAAFGGIAFAQTSPDGPSNTGLSPAVSARSGRPAAGAPVPGRNSFTQSQAADRISRAGYADVSGLKKDRQGIWRGTAQKGGSTVAIALDYRGDVVSQ